MSAGNGCSRRSVLGGGWALGAAASVAAAAQGTRAAASNLFVTPPPRIAAPAGVFLGVEDDRAAANAYRGICYGVAQRFCAPTAPPDATQPVPALAFGPVCPQSGSQYQPQSEDCLFLNIWTPAFPARRPRPVMLYIHGGAYSNGSVTDPVNDGAMLAAQGDVVVVTVNHRLNVLGYLYLATLDPRFPDSGNAGQLDIILALQWVARNIGAFGGDAGNVTLFGQSGGGAKIATLMAMPQAAGLFHKAITMSGQQITASGPLNATRRARAVLDRVGAGQDVATMPVAGLISALAASDPILGGGVYMGPVLDMRHLHRHPFWPDAAPQSRNIPMMLGNAISETRAFYGADSRVLAGLTMDNLAQRIGPEMRIDIAPDWVVAQFRARYPGASALQLFHRIVTAARSWRGQVIEAEERARAGVPAYVYQLDFEDAKHTDDIALAFGTVEQWTPARRAMSAAVMGAFVRFARTGAPGWPAYTLAGRRTMIWDNLARVESNPRAWEREIFARVPYIQPGT
ncbi:MAG: carboxylesterase/lipase family protein [Sphingopyxis sp.]